MEGAAVEEDPCVHRKGHSKPLDAEEDDEVPLLSPEELQRIQVARGLLAEEAERARARKAARASQSSRSKHCGVEENEEADVIEGDLYEQGVREDFDDDRMLSGSVSWGAKSAGIFDPDLTATRDLRPLSAQRPVGPRCAEASGSRGPWRPKENAGAREQPRQVSSRGRREQPSPQDDTPEDLRSVLKDIRCSLSAIATKQDAQHGLVIQRGEKIHQERADRQHDVHRREARSEALTLTAEQTTAARLNTETTSRHVGGQSQSSSPPMDQPEGAWKASTTAKLHTAARERETREGIEAIASLPQALKGRRQSRTPIPEKQRVKVHVSPSCCA